MAVGKLKRISGSIPMESLRGPTGLPGNDGVNGTDGIGVDGKDGRDGTDGVGLPGEKGRDGRDGKDGTTPQHEVSNGEIRFMLANGEWGEWIMMTGGGGGSALSPLNATTLEHIKYNPETNRLVTDVSLETILDSFYLGSMHKMSSAGYGIFFTNLDTNTSFIPAVTGLKDHSIAANRTSSGIIPTHARIYGDYVEFPSNGDVATNEVLYSFPSPLAFDASVFGIQIEPTEDVKPTDVFKYRVYIGSDVEGRQLYGQTFTGITLSSGEILSVVFEHPVDFSTLVSDVYFELKKNGEILKVKAGLDRPDEPWVIGNLRTFEDKSIAFLEDEQNATGKTEWIMGELLTDSIHWTDGQIIAWPSVVTGAEALGDYVSWAPATPPV